MLLAAAEEIQSPPDTTVAISYRIAETRQEREAAFRLVYASYLRGGLGGINRYQMRVTPYHLLPTTEVFIAEYQDNVIFTMSLVMDGALGVPMEHVYGEEIADMRRRGVRFAEISCLADRRASLLRFFPVFFRASRLMVQYAQRRGMDSLLAAVHPKHARLYRRCFDFRVMGQQRDYPAARNRPALALSGEYGRLLRDRPEVYESLLGDPFSDEELRPRPIGAADCEYFRPMIDPAFQCGPIGAELETAAECVA
jgi:hypothetical protein